jgi:hypothetical protein
LSGVAFTIGHPIFSTAAERESDTRLPARRFDAVELVLEPTPTPRNVAGNVSENHGHTAVVFAAHITAASAVRLDIRGSANHGLSVDLSAGGSWDDWYPADGDERVDE